MDKHYPRAVRVLILHSTYLSGPASGENRVVEDEIQLLRSRGHDVASWTPTPMAASGPLGKAHMGAGAVWSRAAASKVRSLVRRHRPEVVHIHNLFPLLSPTAILVSRSEGVPVVLTLHNYRLLCLPGDFRREGKACEDCLTRLPWPGVVHRCYRDSRAASLALATSISLHRGLRTFDRISLFLAGSRFVKRKHVQGGIHPDRIMVKPNFANPVPRREGPGAHFVYLGRVSKEKGVDTLIEAWRSADAPLLVAGDGPLRNELEARRTANVQFLGMVPGDRSAELLKSARALILPSVLYEAAPRTIPEAYAAGVPVIATNAGAIPEFVEDGGSGLLVPPGNPGALASAVGHLMDDVRCKELGGGALRLWYERFTPDKGAEALEQAYSRVTGATV